MKTLQETAYDEILRAIVSGELLPGERITMQSLSKQMNVSMMPIREALRKLEAGQLVTIERNRRITVNKLSIDNFKEIMEIRLMLEGHAAVRANRNRNESLLPRLKMLHNQITTAKNSDALLKLNRKFHSVIYHEAHMPITESIINSLWERVNPYLSILLKQPQKWKKYNVGKLMNCHLGIIDGLERNDSKIVKKWLRKDLNEGAAEVIRMLKDLQCVKEKRYR